MNQASINDLLASPLQVNDTADDRAAFYLKNRTTIETWALLRREAASAVQNAIFDLAGPLEADLQQLGVINPVIHTSDGSWPIVAAAAPDWRRGPGLMPILVGIECVKTPISERGDLAVYATVIAPPSHPMSKTLAPAVAELSGTLRSRLGHGWKVSLPRWPVFKYVTTAEEPWTVNGLANQFREAFLGLWVVAAPEIDRMMAEVPPLPAEEDAAAEHRV